jgi:predicted phosphate transport protein (TIGR00153 family)
MFFRRKPRGSVFFDLFSTAGDNISTSVELLRDFVTAPLERRDALAVRMHEAENAGDDATHAIIEQLDRSFITPFDREDLYRLASRLDDVVDHMDAAVSLANLYAIPEFPDGVRQQVDLLCQAARLTADAMPELAAPHGLTAYWVAINELENEADQVHRQLLSLLFSGGYEPLEVMKLKDVVEELESAADAFEHVADVVHTIAVKES